MSLRLDRTTASRPYTSSKSCRGPGATAGACSRLLIRSGSWSALTMTGLAGHGPAVEAVILVEALVARPQLASPSLGQVALEPPPARRSLPLPTS